VSVGFDKERVGLVLERIRFETGAVWVGVYSNGVLVAEEGDKIVRSKEYRRGLEDRAHSRLQFLDSCVVLSTHVPGGRVRIQAEFMYLTRIITHLPPPFDHSFKEKVLLTEAVVANEAILSTCGPPADGGSPGPPREPDAVN